MLLTILNSIAGVFGYRWIEDNSKDEITDTYPIADEDWDHIHENNRKYKLEKIANEENNK